MEVQPVRSVPTRNRPRYVLKNCPFTKVIKSASEFDILKVDTFLQLLTCNIVLQLIYEHAQKPNYALITHI